MAVYLLFPLASVRKSLQPSAYETHTHLAHAVVKYLGLNAPGELGTFGITTAADIVDLISRVSVPILVDVRALIFEQFTTNSFTLTSPSLTPLGVSVSPLVALINHSCEPNAVVVYPRSSCDPSRDEPEMQVIAIKDISPDQEVRCSKLHGYGNIVSPARTYVFGLSDFDGIR